MGNGWKSGARGGKLVKPVNFRDLRVTAVPEADAEDGDPAGEIDKFALYQAAVQAPQGDISWMLRFYRQYVGIQMPLHLREDFCGTAAICGTWCKGDVRRTATGVDIDREALAWGAEHNGDDLLGGSATDQLCLLLSNVLDDVSGAPRVLAQLGAAAPGARARAEAAAAKGCRSEAEGSSLEAGQQDPSAVLAAPTGQSGAGPAAVAAAPAAETEGHAAAAKAGESEARLRAARADVVASLNFSLCLLHTRELASRYLRLARASMEEARGSIMVLDLLGGPSAEMDLKLDRSNTVTGASFLWEQEGFSPLTRQIFCHISLRQRGVMVLPRIWNYHWRMWTIPEATELLLAAGFDAVHVWLRPMRQTRPASNGGGPKVSAVVLSADLHGSSPNEARTFATGPTGIVDLSGGARPYSVEHYQLNPMQGRRRRVQDSDEEEEEEAEFQECSAGKPLPAALLERVHRGWTAYLVAVVHPQTGS